MATNELAKYRIMGAVQGVGMRNWIALQATQRELAGWVRNEADGSVGVLLIGSFSALGNAQEWLTHGPPAAEVIDITSLEPDDTDKSWDVSAGFNILF